MSTVRIRLNGEATAIEAGNVAELVQSRGLPAEGRGVAIAVNEAVVPRDCWPSTPLKPDDRVEIVRVMVGG